MLRRDFYLNKIIKYQDTEFIKVITGVRRSGKSYLLRMFQEHLEEAGLADSVIYLNFEHPDTFNLNTSEALYEYIQKHASNQRKTYFLFDEIQEVEGWSKLINGLRVAYDCDLYITGSNATLLSGEMASYLSGRYVEIAVYPLSFTEFLAHKEAGGLQDKQAAFNEYIQYGGFPSAALLADSSLKQDVLKGIYNSILLRDVSQRGNISNIDLLMRISLYLMDNIGQTVSASKIADYLTSAGTQTKASTVDKYLMLLENSFIFYKAVRYDIRGKERLKTLGKYYAVDTGLRNIVLGRQNINVGSQIENIVYLKLRQSGYDVFVGKYDQAEIDFVCFKNEDVLYVQVVYELPRNSDRETRHLLLIRDNYKKLIVSMNYFNVGSVDGVEVIHLFDFLENSHA